MKARRQCAALPLAALLLAGCVGTEDEAPLSSDERRIPAEQLASLPDFEGTAADYQEALDACEQALSAFAPFRDAVQQDKTSVAALNPLLTDLEDAVPNKIFGLEAINFSYYNFFASLGGVDRDLQSGAAKNQALATTLERGQILADTCAEIDAVDKLRN